MAQAIHAAANAHATHNFGPPRYFETKARSRSQTSHRLARLAASSSQQLQRQDAITKDYLSWAETAGIIFPKITQSYFEHIRGTKAVESIAPEEFFVTVPRSAALVVEPTSNCPIPEFVSPQWWKQAPWYFKMASLLLHEASKGRSSPVWGYIVQLPDSIDTPVRWSPEEISQLQYPPLERDIQKQQEIWKDQYNRFKEAAKGLLGNSVTFDQFIWAAENVRSRAFSGPYAGTPLKDRLKIGGIVAMAGLMYVLATHVPVEQALNGAIAAAVFNLLYDVVLSSKLKWYALCPVIDAINHSSRVESTIEYEYFKDTFVAATNTAYTPGQQVFISYGKQPNSSLLQYYGFIEDGNVHDIYAIESNLTKGTLIFSANGNLTPESLKFAREACMNNEGELRKSILKALEDELASKKTSIEDDERALGTPHLLSSRTKTTLEFRIDKKKLLKRAISRAIKKLK